MNHVHPSLQPARSGVTYFNKGILLVAIVIAALVAMAHVMDGIPPVPFIPKQHLFPLAGCWVLLLSLVTFLAFVIDKLKATFSWSRISENTLLLLAALGGSPGAIAAMVLVHHKTRKQPFAGRFVLIVALQVAAFFVAGVAGHQAWGRG